MTSEGRIVRYTFRERAVHLTAAVSYVYLLLTGLAFWTPAMYWLAIVLGGGLECGTPLGSIAFPADGANVCAVGAAGAGRGVHAGRDPDLDADARYGWLEQIAAGLQALHTAGAILEGIRPELITVTDDGQLLCHLTQVNPLVPGRHTQLPNDRIGGRQPGSHGAIHSGVGCFRAGSLQHRAGFVWSHSTVPGNGADAAAGNRSVSSASHLCDCRRRTACKDSAAEGRPGRCRSGGGGGLCENDHPERGVEGSVHALFHRCKKSPPFRVG